MHVAQVVVEEIGIGMIVGLALTWSTALMLRFAEPLDQRPLGGDPDRRAGGGALCRRALAEWPRRAHTKELLGGAEHTREALALLTWVVFGGIVVAGLIDRVTWPALLYDVLSLTVVRMPSAFLCPIGTRTSTADELFIGWFGSRGLATLVLAVLVLDAKLPGNDTLTLAAVWTVLGQCHRSWGHPNPMVRRIADRSPVEATR
jgi:NhaP-type Na+/H+ or K+/H+ antiporter